MPPTPITLALQGGGSHGAFAWGALDQLLLDGRFQIRAITAASGGAMNAAVLAGALAQDGPEAAREQLKIFWRKISITASMLPIRAPVVDKWLGSVGVDLSPSTVALDYITRMFSPYQFNLFDLNPLRAIVEETVDFDALRKQKDIALYVNATQVQTGECRVFSTPEITLDVVMASACLPFLFKTVQIRGEPYWDGGYSGNPSLRPLLESGKGGDVLLIESAIRTADEVPTRAADILDRATEISFAQALKRDLDTVEQHNRHARDTAIRIHRIGADELLASLGRASKLKADWDFLIYLHDLGVQAAADWLERENAIPNSGT